MENAIPLPNEKVLGVIPARFGSQRFPGKLLAQLAGKSVLQRTYENASRCLHLAAVVIATDDSRIQQHAASFGAQVVLTPEHCTSGTDRIVTVLHTYPQFCEYDLIVNIQGDEPCLPPAALIPLITTLQQTPDAVMATLVAPLCDATLWQSPSVVKCIRDQAGYALYFSRAPVPSSKTGVWQAAIPCWRHVGVYAYRRPFLMQYNTLPATPLQLAEDLEQLKVLEHGFRIITATVAENSIGVDTPEDLQTLEKLLCNVNSSLSPAASALR